MKGASHASGRATIVVISLWTALGAVAALQSVLITAGRPTALSAATALGWQLPQWWAWAALTPLVVHIDARARDGGAGLHGLLALHVVLGAFVILTHSAVVAACDLAFFRDQVFESRFVPLIFLHLRDRGQFEILSYLGLAGGWYAWDYAHRLQRKALAAATLEADLARAELRALESQLQPHFLFNTLQAIAALTERDATLARRSVERLADLLRRVLSSTGRQRVTLAEELDFLHRYLELEHMRFQDRLTVNCIADEEVAAALVPRFLLLPLVENALRHGLAPRPGPVRLDVHGERLGGRVILTVTDDGAGPAARPTGATGSGLGLEITRGRLAHHYGRVADLSLDPRAGGGCVARLRIPFERGAIPAGLQSHGFHMAPAAAEHA